MTRDRPNLCLCCAALTHGGFSDLSSGVMENCVFQNDARLENLAVGAYFDDDGGTNRGAVWVLFLDGVPACPWDCGGDFGGNVGIVDFLALLAQWGQVGTSCDFDGGGVGIVDFLALLAHWGPCP